MSKSIIVSMATSFDVTAGESLGKNGQSRGRELRVVWVYIEKSNLLAMVWRAGGFTLRTRTLYSDGALHSLQGAVELTGEKERPPRPDDDATQLMQFSLPRKNEIAPNKQNAAHTYKASRLLCSVQNVQTF